MLYYLRDEEVNHPSRQIRSNGLFEIVACLYTTHNLLLNIAFCLKLTQAQIHLIIWPHWKQLNY